MRGEKWTREEMILAFNLYLKLPAAKTPAESGVFGMAQRDGF